MGYYKKELKDLTIKEYELYLELLKEDVVDSFEILKLFGYNTDNMSISKFKKISSLISNMKLDTVDVKDYYNIGGRKFKCIIDIDNFKAAQFIDLQNYSKFIKIEQTLSLLLIPTFKDKVFWNTGVMEYGSKYSIKGITELVYDNFNIQDAISIVNKFNANISTLIDGYSELFGTNYGDDNDDTPKKADPFQWIQICENIAEIYKCKISDVYDMNIMEFLNMLGYLTYKNNKINEKYKK